MNTVIDVAGFQWEVNNWNGVGQCNSVIKGRQLAVWSTNRQMAFH